MSLYENYQNACAAFNRPEEGLPGRGLSSGWGAERPNKKNPEGPSPWCLCQQLALVLRRPAPDEAFASIRTSIAASFACLQPT